MASKVRRRSGNAVSSYCDAIGWKPDTVIMAGVGVAHEEVDVMLENWGPFGLIGFEPHPGTYAKIVDRFPGLLLNAALCDVSGVGTLYSRRSCGSLASLWPHPDGEQQEHPVQLARLDDYGIEGTDTLLWLDCEGAELKALKGATRTVLSSVAMINVEMTAKPLIAEWSPPALVHSHLLTLGFMPAWVHSTRCHRGQYDCIYLRKDLYRPEFSCYPETVPCWTTPSSAGS